MVNWADEKIGHKVDKVAVFHEHMSKLLPLVMTPIVINAPMAPIEASNKAKPT